METHFVDEHRNSDDLLWKVRDFIATEIVIFLMWLKKEGYEIDPRGDTCVNEEKKIRYYIRDKYFEYTKQFESSKEKPE